MYIPQSTHPAPPPPPTIILIYCTPVDTALPLPTVLPTVLDVVFWSIILLFIKQEVFIDT